MATVIHQHRRCTCPIAHVTHLNTSPGGFPPTTLAQVLSRFIIFLDSV